MIEKVRNSMVTGLSRMKWIAGYVSERTKSEASIARLLFKSNKLQDKIDNLYADIGKRVMELKEKGEESVFSDFVIQQALDEIMHLKESASDYKKQAGKLNKLPE